MAIEFPLASYGFQQADAGYNTEGKLMGMTGFSGFGGNGADGATRKPHVETHR